MKRGQRKRWDPRRKFTHVALRHRLPPVKKAEQHPWRPGTEVYYESRLFIILYKNKSKVC